MRCWFDFLSIWALVAHALSLARVLPSTLALAFFILGGSIYHKLYTPAPYYLHYDIAIHYVPVAVLFALRREIVLWPVFVLYTIYFAWWSFDFAAIHKMYETNNAKCFESA